MPTAFYTPFLELGDTAPQISLGLILWILNAHDVDLRQGVGSESA